NGMSSAGVHLTSKLARTVSRAVVREVMTANVESVPTTEQLFAGRDSFTTYSPRATVTRVDVLGTRSRGEALPMTTANVLPKSTPDAAHAISTTPLTVVHVTLKPTG